MRVVHRGRGRVTAAHAAHSTARCLRPRSIALTHQTPLHLHSRSNANAPLFSPRPRLKTLRAQLQAYCRFRKAAPGPGQPFEIDPEGCTASAMPLAELDSHQNSCGAAYVTCGMQCGGRECTHRCRRRALHNHKALCHFRLVPCPQGCGTSYQATEVGPHAVVCASRRVRCPFASCDMVLHAAEVPAHNAAFAQEHLRGLQAALDHSNALVTRLTPTAGLPTRVLKLLQDVATRKLAVDAAAASVADLACCASNAEMGAVIWVERGDSVAVHALSSYPEDAACAVHVAALDLLHAVVNAARAACAAAQKILASHIT